MRLLKAGDRVSTPGGKGIILEIYGHDNWCLVKLDNIGYRDFQFKLDQVEIESQ